MKERPILFSGAMVRAILDGKKTQTRRVMHITPIVRELVQDHHCTLSFDRMQSGYPDERVRAVFDIDGEPNAFAPPCPFGQSGDRLWVRESFFDHGDLPDGTVLERDERIEYRASEWNRIDSADGGPWKPSIHMPRWASRITLEITGVRVQRLQEISEADARAEGITDGGCLSCGMSEPCGCNDPKPDARESFVLLWNTLNEKRGYGWATNPWVWALTFKRVDGAA